MYSDNPFDKQKTLREMSNVALQRSNYDRIAAREMMRGFLDYDKRFDQYDKDRLVRRVEECQYSGAKLNLDDPRLMKNGEARPLEKTHWQY